MHRFLTIVGATAFCALLVVAIVFAPSAKAMNVEGVGARLSADPVYVDEDVAGTISEADIAKLREAVAASDRRMYVAILPIQAARVNEGLVQLSRRVAYRVNDQQGTYIVVAGGEATAVSGILPKGASLRLLQEAQQANAGKGQAATLLAAIDLMQKAPTAPDDASDNIIGQSPIVNNTPPETRDEMEVTGKGIAIFATIFGAIFAFFGAITVLSNKQAARERVAKEQRAKEREVELAKQLEVLRVEIQNEVRAEREHLTRVRALAVAKPDPDAVACCDLAEAALASAERYLGEAKSMSATQAVGKHMAEARYQIAGAEALATGRLMPERRSPCVFDPAHGVSYVDVAYTFTEGELVDAPACDACARAITAGTEPESRKVDGGEGQRVPYWRKQDAPVSSYLRGHFQTGAVAASSSAAAGTSAGAAATGVSSHDNSGGIFGDNLMMNLVLMHMLFGTSSSGPSTQSHLASSSSDGGSSSSGFTPSSYDSSPSPSFGSSFGGSDFGGGFSGGDSGSGGSW